jgi:hypothetical protein
MKSGESQWWDSGNAALNVQTPKESEYIDRLSHYQLFKKKMFNTCGVGSAMMRNGQSKMGQQLFAV